MELPQIRLQSTYSQIEMNTTPAKQSIEQPSAEIDIKQPPAELSISRTPAKLTIDQSQAWAEMDLEPISVRVSEFAQNGYRDWLDGLARTAEEGKELMTIENGGHIIPRISKRDSEPTQHEFNIGLIPSPFSVKTNFEPATLDIQWKTNKPIIQTQARKPIIDYVSGQVETELKQRPDLKVDFANLKFVGVNYEQEI